MDERDPLRAMRANFHVPLVKQLPSPPVDAAVVSLDEECVYLCGNSLGAPPTLACHRTAAAACILVTLLCISHCRSPAQAHQGDCQRGAGQVGSPVCC